MSGLAWDDGDVPLLRWASAPAGVGVAFTSRRGGVSDGPFRSLNLGALTADAATNVAALTKATEQAGYPSFEASR